MILTSNILFSKGERGFKTMLTVAANIIPHRSTSANSQASASSISKILLSLYKRSLLECGISGKVLKSYFRPFCPRPRRHNRKLNSILLHFPIPNGTDPSSRYRKSISKHVVELIDTELGYMERDDRDACIWSQERCTWRGSSD